MKWRSIRAHTNTHTHFIEPFSFSCTKENHQFEPMVRSTRQTLHTCVHTFYVRVLESVEQSFWNICNDQTHDLLCIVFLDSKRNEEIVSKSSCVKRIRVLVKRNKSVCNSFVSILLSKTIRTFSETNTYITLALNSFSKDFKFRLRCNRTWFFPFRQTFRT